MAKDTLFDNSLLIGLQQQRCADQARCYRLLSGPLYQIIWQLCRHTPTAADLLHDTFLIIFAQTPYFEGEHFVPWCKRIAINQTLNWLKRQQRWQHSELDPLNDTLFEAQPPEELDSDNQFEQLMALLKPQARLVLWLFIVEEYSHKEIAALTGRSESFSKSIVSRSLSRLRTYLEENGNASSVA